MLSDSAAATVLSTCGVDGRPASTCPKQVVVHPALRTQNPAVCSNGLMHFVGNNDSNIVSAFTTSTAAGDESKNRKALVVATVKVWEVVMIMLLLCYVYVIY